MSGLQIEGAPAPTPTPSADAALVAGLVGHDPEAVADLYDRYAERLLGFCSGVLRDPHEAADALHDTVLVAAERIGQLRDPERLRPWLYAIARTQCLARLRRRERTAVAEDPAALAGGRPMGADAGAEDDGARAVEGGEAAEIVWAAAEGLDEGDRVLLELHLRQGLTGGELAAAAGVKPGQISMVTGRMRERLERALGALLVARHGRRDCDELDGILRDWDGRLTVLMRKRVARHLDRCAVCDDRRSGLVAPLGSMALGAPVVLVAGDLRAALVAGAQEVWGGAPAPDVTAGQAWDADGFPPDPPTAAEAVAPRVRRRAAIAAAAAVLVLLGALVAWRSTGRTDGDEVRADGGAEEADDVAPNGGAGGSPRSDERDGATTEPASDGPAEGGTTAPAADPDATTTTVAPGPTAPADGAPATTQPAIDAPSAGPGGAPADPGQDAAVPIPGPGPGSGTGSGSGSATTPAPPAPPVPNPAPTIGSPQLAPNPFQAVCNPANDTAEASVVVSDTGGTLSVRLFHNGPGGAAGIPMTFSGGRHRATIGGFTTPGTYSWRVQASDGTSTTQAGPWSFAVDPCPG